MKARDSLNIIVLDPDQASGKLMLALLEQISCVEQACLIEKQPDLALQRVQSGEFDICLLTARFCEWSADQFIAKARGGGSTCGFILLTDGADIESDLRILRSGALDYLTRQDISVSRLERSIAYAHSRKIWEDEIQDRLALDKLVTAMSMRFVNLRPSEIDREIRAALMSLGEFAGGDRCFIFQLAENAAIARMSHEWCAVGIDPVIGIYRRIKLSDFAWIVDQLREQQCLHISDSESLSSEAVQAGDFLRARSIESCLIVPMLYRGSIKGAIGFTSHTTKGGWPEPIIRLLRIAGEILANSLEQKRVQEALSESEERYRSLIEHLGEGILYSDTEDIILHVNNRMTEISGYSVKEMLGSPATELLLPPEEQHLLRERTLRRLQGISEEYEILLMRKNGERFWAQISAVPISDSEGRIIGTLGAVTDISERRKAQEDLKFHKEFLRQVIDTSPNMIFVKDESFRFTLVNKAFADTYGMTPQQMVGKSDFDVHSNSAEAEMFVQDCSEVLATGKPKIILEQKMRHPVSGKDIWFHTIRKPLVMPDGRSMQVLSVAMDITERVRAESEAINLQKQLLQSQKMEAIGQLAAGVAHDLNNALGAVVGHLQLIQMERGGKGSEYESLEIALDGCERALSLVEQLLGFSRQGKYNLADMPLSEIVNETVAFLGRVINKNITIERKGEDEAFIVRADQGQIQQALTNLIINANQAMPEGGELCFTYFSTYIEDPQRLNPKSQAGEYVCLEVRDSGVGIAPENLDKVFEPFYTTKEHEAGTGLGLAMVYGIMQNHGGWVEVKSEAGRGACFTLYFPRLKQSAKPALPLPSDCLPANDRLYLSGQVMVVDDEAILVDLTRKFLELAGLSSIGFSSGDEAVKWYEANSQQVSLIILDMKMSKMDGKACFDAFRRINPSAKVVILSGYIQDAEAQALLDRGALRFFQKPLKFQELVDWVSQTIKMQKAA